MRFIEKNTHHSLKGIASKIASLFSPPPAIEADLKGYAEEAAIEAARGFTRKS